MTSYTPDGVDSGYFVCIDRTAVIAFLGRLKPNRRCRVMIWKGQSRAYLEQNAESRLF